MFDVSWVRFGVSGTLIGLYGVIDYLARRRGASGPRPSKPAWVRPLMLLSITAFYLLIGPQGGPLLGGWGNASGIALACAAFVVRLAGPVRYPDLAARCLFYLALPIAVGVPWGELVLSLPACAASVYLCMREERRLATAARRAGDLGLGRRYRMFYGIW